MFEIVIVTFVTAFALVTLLGHVMVAKALMTPDASDGKPLANQRNEKELSLRRAFETAGSR